MESQGESVVTSRVLQRLKELSPQEAFQLLEDVDTLEGDDIVTTAVPPVRPKAGEVYLFRPDEESNAGKCFFKCSALFRAFYDLILILEDWRCDQYRWFQNGDKKLPTSQPIVRKKYFIADTPEGRNSGFKRHSYTLLDSSKLSTLVHYIGDDSIGSQHPHGNMQQRSKAIYQNVPISS